MNIELTPKEFRRLLDMVYIGNWVLNSTRGEDRFADYDDIQESSSATAPSWGSKSCTPPGTGTYSPPRPLRRAAYMRP